MTTGWYARFEREIAGERGIANDLPIWILSVADESGEIFGGGFFRSLYGLR